MGSSTVSIYNSVVLDLCFDCARRMFGLFRSKLSVFRLCSTYVWSFSVEIEYVSTVLDVCLVFFGQNRVCFGCARRMFSLFRSKLSMFRPCSTYVSIVLDLCFDFLNRNRTCSDFVLDLKLLFDHGISVANLQFLGFQSRNISRAPRPG